MLEFIRRQVEKGKKETTSVEPKFTELKREGSQEKLTLNLNMKRKVEG